MNIEASWRKEQIDLAELARLRWVEKQKLERIAARMGLGTTTAKLMLQQIKKNPDLVGWKDFKGAIRKIRGW